jgi:hypothetical protein
MGVRERVKSPLSLSFPSKGKEIGALSPIAGMTPTALNS